MHTPTLDVIYDVIAERGRQIDKGHTAADDSRCNADLQLVGGAFTYATGNVPSWPYKTNVYEKLGRLTRRERLVRATAMLVAEIERMDFNDAERARDASNS